MAENHETQEGVGVVGGGVTTVEQAVALHHLATADPEPERDGLMTGPAHEKKYGLERAAASAARWIAQGVHPFENRALHGDEEGAENLRGAPSAGDVVETATASRAPETTAAPRASEVTA